MVKTIEYKHKGVAVFLILFSMPFLQLGLTFYESFAFVLFIFLFIYSARNFKVDAYELNCILLGCIGFLIKICSLAFLALDTRTVLIPIRELLCFWGIILIAVSISQGKINIRLVRNIIFAFLIIVMIMVLFQLYSYTKGKYFGFPIQYFVINQGTLANADLAISIGFRFRPTSFYGEPSYTSFITLSLLTALFALPRLSNRFLLSVIALCLTIVALSQSIAGLMAVSILIGFWFVFFKDQEERLVLDPKKIALLIIMATLAILLVLFFFNDIGTRFYDIINSQDESSNIRFLKPLTFINQLIIDNQYFGSNDISDITVSNAFFYLIIEYGFLGFFIIFALLKFLRNRLLVIYILLTFNFNGAFFSFDKSLILGLVFGIHFMVKRWKANGVLQPAMK